MAIQLQPDYRQEALHAGPVAGIDEAGRGPWAGPVVAAAVILDPMHIPQGIRDSKTLTAGKRAALFNALHDAAMIGIGEASVAEIDRLNILQASMLAMQRAVAALPVKPIHALVDGNKAPLLTCPASCLVKGDSISLSIAAASIIAKVSRDNHMRQLAEAFPHYGWERNAGYGTDAHQAGLRRHGVTPHHRRSFAPIARLLEKEHAA